MIANQDGIVSGLDMPGVIYHVGSKTLFTSNLASTEVPKPSEVVLEHLDGDQKVALWGETNVFPQEVIADIEKSDIIDTVLDWKARTLVGEGVVYGNMVAGSDGAAVLKPMFVPEIDRWLNRTNFDLFAYESALDFYTFYNANVELERARNGSIIGAYAQDQSWLRLAQNDSRGMITKAYLSSCWDTATDVSDRKKVITLDALDPYFNIVGQIQESKQHRHLIPLRLQTRGRKYYALAPWNGLRASGWMNLAVAIPKMKLALIENLMHMRYWIEISTEYWPNKYGAQVWKDKSFVDKQKIMAKEVKDFEELMASKEEAGKPKALMTSMLFASHKNENLSLWKVHDQKLEIPNGAYLEDSAETDYHIVRGLGVDPALVGIAPGKNSASPGSGSADRIKRTNYLLGARPHGTRLLSFMSAVAEINGWDKAHNGGNPIVWMYRSLHTATLDKSNQVTPEESSNNAQV